MQQKILHKQFTRIKDLREEYRKEALLRERKLKDYKALVIAGCKKSAVLKVLGISKASLYRWKKRYSLGGLIALEDETKAPINRRKADLRAKIEPLVVSIRQANPLWGKYKIACIIKREHGIMVSASTVGRVLSRLIKMGFIKPIHFFYGREKAKRPRNFNRHAQRWKYGMKTLAPGELVQVDHTTVELENGLTIKHFKAVCPLTKLTSEQAYIDATSLTATHFLEHMKKTLPFGIRSIQVDGGSEFMAEFENRCQQDNIDLFVLPPKSPKYNGNVERGNSTVKYEFYYQHYGRLNMHNIRKKLQEFVVRYNTFRPHQALQYLTPWEYYSSLEV